MIVAGALLALPAAAATRGQISYDGCLADDATDGCVDLLATPLTGASGVAVSPDGGSVYIASFNSHSIAHFFRGPDGQLSYDGCLADDGADGCGDLPATPLTGASGLAVSPDRGSVYVASPLSNSVAHFFRAPQGQLSYGGCLANDGANGCGDLPFAPLTGASAVAVSPDGGSVYVASPFNDSVAHFFRAPQGQLSYGGCLANDGANGCGDLPFAPLTGASGVAVSPDGGSVYVASPFSDSVAHFFRAPDGQLSYGGCLANDGANGCGDLPFAPLDGAREVAASPDGGSVYVASDSSDSIAHFFRKPQGQLVYDRCLANTAADGCGDLPLAPLDGARRVAVSPDGGSVYVSSFFSNSIAHFLRAAATPPPAPPPPPPAPPAPPPPPPAPPAPAPPAEAR
ncbi:MAG TPA: hypothetical protein VG144_02815, partial [Gaiellaceae bacterium]|nr:hypothetical protein [Gaiellaceae bacterium]